MIRVFLAEDDAAVRKAIRNGIRWAEEGFDLVGEAGDGSSAMAMIQDLSPDIVISSREMPFFSGTSLLRAVRHLIPWAQFILISGHDNSSEAFLSKLPSGTQWLVKPVDMYALTEALHRACGLAEAFFRSLEERMRWPAGQDLSIDAVPLPRGGEGWRLLKLSLAGEPPAEWPEDVLSLLYHTQSPAHGIYAVRLPGNAPGILISAGEDGDLEGQAYGTADAAVRLLERLAGWRVSVRISSPVRDAETLQAALAELEDDQDPLRRVQGPGDAMRLHPGVCPPINPMGEWLLCAQEEEIPGTLATCARAGLLSPVRMAAAARQLMQEAGVEDAEDWLPARDQRGIQDQLTRAVRLAREAAPWLSQSPLSFVRRHLSIRFRDGGLLLYHVARECGLGAERFRVVFAQEMGVTFTEYMRRIRISGAKALLSDTRMRVSSVARAVGYSDPEVFIHLFQQYTGMTPRDYRRQNQTPNPR